MTLHDMALIPGLNNTAALWGDVIACMGPRVRAHAYTNPPLDNVEAIALHWLEQLPERFHLCGTSFGGYVAMAILELAPQRVASLALICSNARADTETQVATRTKAIETAENGNYEEIIAGQIGLAVHPDRLTDSDLISRRNRMVADYGKARYVAHLKAAIARPDRSGLFTSCKAPKLIVAAAQDKLFPLASMRDFAGETNAEIKVIDRSGHLAAMEQPEALAEILAHWAGQTSPGKQ